jgi:hypothetical protein
MDLSSIRNFMIIFGLIRSVFDIVTFVTLREGFGANEPCSGAAAMKTPALRPSIGSSGSKPHSLAGLDRSESTVLA